MATAATIRELSKRLERDVERHGCACVNCPMCADLEECIAVAPARAAAARLPVQAADVPEAPEDSLYAVFGGFPSVY